MITTIGDYVAAHGGYGTLIGILIGVLFVVGCIAAVIHDERESNRPRTAVTRTSSVRRSVR